MCKGIEIGIQEGGGAEKEIPKEARGERYGGEVKKVQEPERGSVRSLLFRSISLNQPRRRPR